MSIRLGALAIALICLSAQPTFAACGMRCDGAVRDVQMAQSFPDAFWSAVCNSHLAGDAPAPHFTSSTEIEAALADWLAAHARGRRPEEIERVLFPDPHEERQWGHVYFGRGKLDGVGPSETALVLDPTPTSIDRIDQLNFQSHAAVPNADTFLMALGRTLFGGKREECRALNMRGSVDYRPGGRTPFRVVVNFDWTNWGLP